MLLAAIALGYSLGQTLPDGPPQTVRFGPWQITVPALLRPLAGAPPMAFVGTLADHHTLAMQIAPPFDAPWSDLIDSDPGTLDEAGRAAVLRAVVEYLTRNSVRGYFHTDERFPFSFGEIRAAFDLPDRGFCRTVYFRMLDTRVPDHEGAGFVLHGFEMTCADFAADADMAHFARVSLSERYCEALAHRPIADLQALAEQVFDSLRFTAGPGHDPRTGQAGGPPSAVPSALPRLDAAFPDAPRAALPPGAATCPRT